MPLNLAPGERIVWQGQPRQGFRFAPQDAIAVPFAAFWLVSVSAIFGMVFIGDATQVDPFVYFVLPVFMCLGLYMLVGRFVIDRHVRRRTRYWLTNQRAFIESRLFRSGFSSVSLAVLPEVKYKAGSKGRGTIQFGSSTLFTGLAPSSWPGARQFMPPTFEDVEDGQRVFELALSAQREAQSLR